MPNLRTKFLILPGTLKGVGRVYQQTVIDTYAKVAFAKLYDRKTPITAPRSSRPGGAVLR